jgi:hypothetical protein
VSLLGYPSSDPFFMALMFGRVADGYFTVHGETGIPEA